MSGSMGEFEFEATGKSYLELFQILPKAALKQIYTDLKKSQVRLP